MTAHHKKVEKDREEAEEKMKYLSIIYPKSQQGLSLEASSLHVSRKPTVHNEVALYTH